MNEYEIVNVVPVGTPLSANEKLGILVPLDIELPDRQHLLPTHKISLISKFAQEVFHSSDRTDIVPFLSLDDDMGLVEL